MPQQKQPGAPGLEAAPTLTPALPANVVEAPPLATARSRIVLALHVDETRCLSCAGCISVCPRMTVPISLMNSLAEGILCRGCGLCVQVCPVEALSQIPVVLPDPPPRPAVLDRRHAARLGPPDPDETH